MLKCSPTAITYSHTLSYALIFWILYVEIAVFCCAEPYDLTFDSAAALREFVDYVQSILGTMLFLLQLDTITLHRVYGLY